MDTEVSKCYMDDYIVERLSRHSMKDLRKLAIWDKEFLHAYGLDDPRRKLDKMIHSYLERSTMKKDMLPIRIVDKMIKALY